MMLMLNVRMMFVVMCPRVLTQGRCRVKAQCVMVTERGPINNKLSLSLSMMLAMCQRAWAGVCCRLRVQKCVCLFLSNQ